MMTFQQMLDFCKTAKTEYDAIVTLAEDEAFREKLLAFIASVQALLGTGVVQFLWKQAQAQFAKLFPPKKA